MSTNQYVEQVAPLYPSTVKSSELVKFGHTLCHLDHNGGDAAALSALHTGSLSNHDARTQLHAALTYLCP